MADDRLEVLDGTKAAPAGAPRPENPIKVAAAAEAASRAASTGAEDAIRSVYVARTTAAATVAAVATIEVAGDGVAVRGAYVTHLLDRRAGSGGGGELGGGDSLRSAYVAHLAAGAPREAKGAKAPGARRGKRVRRKAK